MADIAPNDVRRFQKRAVDPPAYLSADMNAQARRPLEAACSATTRNISDIFHGQSHSWAVKLFVFVEPHRPHRIFDGRALGLIPDNKRVRDSHVLYCPGDKACTCNWSTVECLVENREKMQ